jgi:hypothetical protein
MWRYVYPGLTGVSEERISSIFRVEKSGSGELASASGCRLSHHSETTSYIRTWRERGIVGHIREDDILHSHRCENFKSYILTVLLNKPQIKSKDSIAGSGNFFLFFTALRQALGLNNSSIKWVLGSDFPDCKEAEA